MARVVVTRPRSAVCIPVSDHCVMVRSDADPARPADPDGSGGGDAAAYWDRRVMGPCARSLVPWMVAEVKLRRARHLLLTPIDEIGPTAETVRRHG